jgi:hypothetical protein
MQTTFARIVPADPMTAYYNPALRFQVRDVGGWSGVHFETRGAAEALVATLRVCSCGMIATADAPHFAKEGHEPAGAVAVSK